MAEVLVVGKKISEMDLVTDIVGDEKIPTGVVGDKAVTTGQLLTYLDNNGKVQWGHIEGDIANQADLQNQFTQERNTLKSYTQEQVSQQQVALQEHIDSTNEAFEYARDNGSALPYKEGISYNEGAVVVKDGELQQWKGGDWRSAVAEGLSDTIQTFNTTEAGIDPVTGVADGAYFNVRSSNDESYIDEYQNVGGVATPTGKSCPSGSYVETIADYTALPFKQGKNYALYERVQLNNGDIVKSSVDGNTNDPNVDMTGWINENGNFVDASIFGIKSSRTEDQTDKFKKAIQFAAKLGYMGLEVPSGFFVVSDTLFLVERDSSGNPLRSNYGVPLVGNGVYNTVFLFKPNAPEHVLFDTYGVSAVDSNKLVRGITVRPYVEPSLNPFNHRDIVKSSYFHQGIGLNVRETCNSPYDDLDIKGLKVGIQLTCGNGEPISYTGHDATDASRGWCEFNKFNKINLWLNKVQIRFWGGGSYHGSSFRNCKIQGVEKSVWQVLGVSSAICYGIQAIGAINTDRTNDTYWNTANLYNCYFDVNLFGNHDVDYKFIAIQMDNARTFCNTGGRITHEGDVYFEAKGNGWWTFDGDINGYNDKLLTSESLNNVTPFGNFAFRNWSSNLIGDGMKSIRPVINSGGNSNIFRLAEEPDNGYDNPFPRAANSSAFPDIFRVNGSNIESLAFTVLDFNQYNNFWFGVNSINNKPKDFKPTFKFNAYGTNHTVYSAGSSYAFNIYSEDGVTQKTGYRVESNALTPASASHSMSLGTSSVPFSGLFTTQWTVNGGVCVPKLTATNSIGSSSLTIKDIFLQNAPTVVSDRNHKTEISELTEQELQCAIACGKLYRKYKLNAAIDEKGLNDARYHTGVIAQEVVQCFTDHNLDWRKYGIITHEKWDAIEATEYQAATYDENDQELTPEIQAIEAREAGEIYMVRYDELNCFINAGIEYRLSRLE